MLAAYVAVIFVFKKRKYFIAALDSTKTTFLRLALHAQALAIISEVLL